MSDDRVTCMPLMILICYAVLTTNKKYMCSRYNKNITLALTIKYTLLKHVNMVVGILNTIEVKPGVPTNVYRMHIPSVQSLVYSH